MQLVICDTGPINYLVLIGHIEILPALFQEIVMPPAVQRELEHLDAPPQVRKWISSPPTWIKVQKPPKPSFYEDLLRSLDEGEREAIELAAALHADLLLMDDRAGVKAALQKGMIVTGTIGVLRLAAKQGLLDLANAFALLRRTSFHCPEALMQKLLAEQDHA